ncbi:hypothetical protein Tco_0932680 [Tanacetum coccineum]
MAATQAVQYAPQCGDITCTAVASDPNPPADNSEARPLKEFIIKFTVMNGKKPLTLEFKTFCESTGLDYKQGKYVAHPSPKVVKVELAKIATSEALVQTTPVLKTSFPVAWRILLTFVVQTPATPPSEKVPTEDSDKTKSVSSGQTAYPQDTKGHIQPAVMGSHSPLAEGIRKSKPFPEGKPTEAKDSEGNKQPANKGLPAIVPDEGISKTKPLPERTKTDPKDSERIKPLTDMGSSTPPVTALLGTDAEYHVDQT